MAAYLIRRRGLRGGDRAGRAVPAVHPVLHRDRPRRHRAQGAWARRLGPRSTCSGRRTTATTGRCSSTARTPPPMRGATPTRCCSSTSGACSPSISAAAMPTTRPIAKRLREGAGPSLSLTVPLFMLGLVVGVAVALFVAFFRETYIDRAVLVLCMLTMSIAGLLYIIGGQYLVGMLLRWFPISGFDPNAAVVGRFLALPVLVGVVTGFGARRAALSHHLHRGDEPRLRAHRPRQGLRRRPRHGAARAAQRADPDPHQHRHRHPVSVHRRAAAGILLRHSRARLADGGGDPGQRLLHAQNHRLSWAPCCSSSARSSPTSATHWPIRACG